MLFCCIVKAVAAPPIEVGLFKVSENPKGEALKHLRLLVRLRLTGICPPGCFSGVLHSASLASPCPLSSFSFN